MKDYKRIPFSNMHNCRDLGGYGCMDGGFFQYHKLYRADTPFMLSEEEWKEIFDMGVRTIVDLRSVSEQEFMQYEVPEGIRKISMPLMNEDINLKDFDSVQESSANAFGRSLLEGYSDIISNNTGKVVAVLKAIIEGLERGAVLYHCSAGKDRTGVISALIYLLCGVEREDIIADYQVTAIYNSKNKYMEKVSASWKETCASLAENFKELSKSLPETMDSLLKSIEEENLMEKLYENGLTEREVESLQKEVICF